ncbi:MAG TPA: hypothetical protein VHK65_06230 [Candidatus Dormibacteraeota bacterium]|nr:hypothetical protein [Candidatus Dormibacteraeota bacterium]
MRVATPLEDRIITLARSGRVAAVFISGSAGGGKSLLVGSLRGTDADAFGSIVEDATHSDSPSELQYQRLIRYLEPLADGRPPYKGKPLLIAMNTGMVIRFFDQLREARGKAHGFTALERELKRRLNLRHAADAKGLTLPGAVAVVNLDHRATTGGSDSLFSAMLRAVDPDADRSVLDGRRCRSCTVRQWCFVRTNAQLISSKEGCSAIDSAADALAFDRGRPLQPRALWDLIADLLIGGEAFTEPDPCDRIASLAADGQGEEVVFWRLATNGIFRRPLPAPRRAGSRRQSVVRAVPPTSRLGQAAEAIRELDPSFKPDEKIHQDLADVGIEPARDRERFVAILGGGPAAREAVVTAGTGLERILRTAADLVPAVARGVVRARWMAGQISLGSRNPDFTAAVSAAAAGRFDDPAIDNVREGVIKGLAAGFGSSVGERFFFRTEAYDPDRDWEILVEIDLESPSDDYLSPFEPVLEANPDGAALVSYRPMSISFRVPGGTTFAVDVQLHRLLQLAAAGTLLSTADLERSYQLRHAAEVIGHSGAQDEKKALLLVKRSESRRFLIYQRRQSLAAREVS